MRKENILITGATGYIGHSLVQRLTETNFPVHCLVREESVEKLDPKDKTNIRIGDLLDAESLSSVFKGIDIVYYLVHNLDKKDNFEQLEKKAAINFVTAAKKAGVKRIIYLGALGNPEEKDLSPHLKSRKEVGEILRGSGIQVIEFQASIIIGSGSLSFEMVRALSERLPVMIMPKWVSVLAQPICIRDVLEYLVQSIYLETKNNEVFQIGGRDRVTYKDLISTYSIKRGLKRLLIPVPVLTPGLSSLWLALITPLYARVGRKLIESIKSPTIVQDRLASSVFPNIHPMGMEESIEYALREKPIDIKIQGQQAY
ncbi:MAG: NAD(P)H-binding protein [Candidatus Nitronauta litoralis]|uniref:NAD(P)H-binding protein n=1 Tax=Candidatus Nitronauta litoralis TaxID=2705533 RepID=A0A7T0BWP4_9BACT|nr:MAG: NAD(P)H-binding protein [Candidatus Nitronauta litoralis]